MEQQNRVILISGDNSKWYEQAIFIVKKNIPESQVPVDFVLEAERVISAYMTKKRRNGDEPALGHLPETDSIRSELTRRTRNMRFNIALNIVLLAGCLTLLGLLMLR
ncbi:MAG: hypothetical protein LBT59_14055 [Clostridiales bacterium]|jgi:hypothetical protein|nr:hypothetical protein [Clostridiales bacterium]